MFLDLFSSLDSNFSKFSLFGGVSIIMVMMFMILFLNTVKLISFEVSFGNSVSLLVKQSLLLKKFYFGTKVLAFSLFFKVLILNLLGLFPYLMSLTSHMALVFVVSVLLYISLLMSSVLKGPLSFFGYFTPQGCPTALGGFLSMMELISSLMRPVTLSLRLGMNMTTGHMFISLLGSSLMLSTLNGVYFMAMVVFLAFGAYFIFELVICLIQGFVYSLLMSQYSQEHS